MADSFDQLPDSARIWVFASAEPLSSASTMAVASATRRFLDGWAAHGAALCAGCRVEHERFLVIALDESRVGASGCSIDALMAHLRQLEPSSSDWLHQRIVYRDESNRIRAVDRAEFRQLAAAGEIGLDTCVFDLTIDSLGQLRNGRLERPARDTWHRRLIESARRGAPASA